MPQQSAADGNGITAFLCHASEDKSAVRGLYSQLRRDGIRPWLDEMDLRPGQDWETEIRKAVRSCRVVIVCLSNKSLTKEGFFHKEIRYALDVADEKPDGTVYIVPARLENCEVPDRLRKWVWVDLFDASGYDKLLRTLESIVGTSTAEKPVERGQSCVIFADGSSFAMDLVALSQQSGFTTAIVEPTALINFAFLKHDLDSTGLVILVRGEHFGTGVNLDFYALLTKYVAGGGFLLATPWVSWETRGLLDNILPFNHPDGAYTENALLTTIENPIAGRFTFHASYEHLAGLKPGATLLMEAESHKTEGRIPILGVRDCLAGCCIYLNVCQHSCSERMESPLKSGQLLANVVRQTLIDAYSEVLTRRKGAPDSGRRVPFIPKWFRTEQFKRLSDHSL